jgi:hypothetical protein
MLDDFDLDKEPATPPPATESREPRSFTPLLIALALLLAAGAAVWFFLLRPQPEQVSATPAPAPAAAAAPPAASIGPLCGARAADEASLPPLNDSDAFASKAASGLAAHPRVAAWLATDNVIRNFVMAVDNVASGATPAARVRVLRPSGAFRVREGSEGTFIDPRSFERYGAIADAVDSVNPATASQVCATLKPRLDEAYRELGRDGSFDVALERAIVALLRTPAAGPDTQVVPNGAIYAFEDPELEMLTPAQKQLARMGPRNVRIIQDKLRQIALAIGIPAERLP